MFLYELSKDGKQYLLGNDLELAFRKFCKKQNKKALLNSPIFNLINHTPELILQEGIAILIYRYQLARYKFYKIAIHEDIIDEISVRELLDLRDQFVQTHSMQTNGKLRLDFMPFYDFGPSIRDVRSIGKGIEFLNKHMSSSLFQKPEQWNTKLFGFLKIHSLGDQQLLVNGSASSNYEGLINDLDEMTSTLSGYDSETPHVEIMGELKRHGFEPGWGNTVGRISDTMQLLLDLFNSPDSENLEKFISRIPMISKIAIISPHGWFGQENVLGRPDTGGQVVYILDQVRALERSLAERLESFGVLTIPKIVVVTRLIPECEGTNSDMRIERIHHTDNSFILRIPFHYQDGTIVRHFISRFEIWPFLERFALEAKKELIGELNGRPDLLIGNYSDGNLVATLLAEQFDVIQCNIAHALEKTKYLFSDLYWTDFEEENHFSIQFVADLIAMNMADFIITSTQQEIAGTQITSGQYESYQFFTMPGLMQVENGINLFDPKFNVIPPGVDENIFFPHTTQERRLPNQTKNMEDLLFEQSNEEIWGSLDDPEKIPIFSMARLDFVKNITGLVESFGKSKKLREKCNLIIIAGRIDTEQTSNAEEKAEISKMHKLIKKHELEGQLRWLGMHLAKKDTGEAYRVIADRKGVFVQPARFEAFGLTVLEAMASGLPTFATQFGGPSEIINQDKNGFLINPTVPELISNKLLQFIERVEGNKSAWDTVSKEAIKRVNERFTWRLYSNKLLNLTALYGFWRYSVASSGKQELSRYCHLLLRLLYSTGAQKILNHKNN